MVLSKRRRHPRPLPAWLVASALVACRGTAPVGSAEAAERDPVAAPVASAESVAAAEPAPSGTSRAPRGEGVRGDEADEPLGRFRPLAEGVAVATFRRAYDPDRTATLRVLRVALAETAFELVPLEEQRFAAVSRVEPFVFAVNGGYFEADFSRSGLARSGGRQLSAASPRGGSGVLVVERGRARLVPFARGLRLGRDVAFALQCGPRLVEPGGVVGIARDDGQRAARTAVCLRDEGRTLDFVVVHGARGFSGPSLFALAGWLADGLADGERGCDAALNLDGGPSTALYVPGEPALGRFPPGPVVDAWVVRTRAQVAEAAALNRARAATAP